MSSTTQTVRPATGVVLTAGHALSFGGTVRAEFRKVLGQRTTPILFGIGVLGYVGIMLLLTVGGTHLSTELKARPAAAVGLIQDILFMVFTVGSGIFLLLTSSRLVGMEYSQGTLRILLARGTGRVGLLVAKLIATYALGLVLFLGFIAASLVWVGAATIHWTGSLSALSAGGSATTKDLGIGVLLTLLSMFSTTVVGSALATFGRSVAFGVGASMALFPADNFGTLILTLISELTHQKFWVDLTQYLLGPALNVLPKLAITNRSVQAPLPAPGGTVSLGHALAVVGVWVIGLLVLQLVLTWRRDVLA